MIKTNMRKKKIQNKKPILKHKYTLKIGKVQLKCHSYKIKKLES
jgi:hypothetical protein